MNSPIPIIVPIVTLAVLYVALPVVLDTYRRLRGPKIITCPETKQSAEIQLNAFPAALSALDGATDIRIEGCSRWPRRSGCNQACLAQLDSVSAQVRTA